jgi:hypothetical protein
VGEKIMNKQITELKRQAELMVKENPFNEYWVGKLTTLEQVEDLLKIKEESNIKEKGCGVLFKSGSGIIICGEKRVDGNRFLCSRCLKENRTK